ncbi:MAG: DNA topoisomerase (ATP-hydrolyzing) subunit B [Actinobacteria bacterium]|nr:DNA topoisomerase (ATP-hydrolyzing) subunit B [Actinomycetota bacterium]
MSEASNDYGAKDITVLEGLEAVRRRPGMYVGSTGARGLHHLVYEVVDNSVDEAMAGRCSRIEVRLLDDGGVRVSDDGRGIPVGEHPRLGKSALEVVLTVLHAGGKFDGKSYAVSGGLHGVGVSVVNALSSRLVADVRRDGRHCRQSYRRGVPDGPVTNVGPAEETGTDITFWADEDVFETVDYNWDTLTGRFRETAFLTAGLTIGVVDDRRREASGGPRRTVFFYERGLRDFVTHLNTTKEPLHDSIIHFSASGQGTDGPHEVEVAVQWNSTYHESIHTFANTINTHEGGTHEEGFKKALTSVVNRFVRDAGAHKGNGRSGRGDLTLTGEDVREGLTAIVSVKMANPQFEGQTKTKLGNTGIRSFVERTCHERLRDWLEEHPAETRRIVAKAVQGARARLAARAARDLTRRKGLLESASLPGKLADCSSKRPEECEIFIVEGDSAGGSSKQARDRVVQAVLPIRGKILNVEKARLGKILENKEIQALITAIGTGIGDEFDLSKARYHKIVMLMDADVDGAHIRTLVLTFAFRHMRELIDAGYFYIAQPPLYQIQPPGKDGRRRLRYAFSDRDRDAILAEMGDGDGSRRPQINRFKGLGEMDAEQLWDTTMDPGQRTLLQVTMEDAAVADQLFTTLMGDDVEARRDFIVRNARDVRFLDV